MWLSLRSWPRTPGLENNSSRAHTSNGGDEYVQLDLQGTFLLSEVTVWNQHDSATASSWLNGAVVTLHDANGNLVDANGKVLASKEQLEAAGYRINENGEIADKNGNVVDPSNIMIAKNGEVLTPEKIAAVAKKQNILGSSPFGGSYELVIGGSSADGVAKKSTKLLTENTTEKVKETTEEQKSE